jgi:hypothetical protein
VISLSQAFACIGRTEGGSVLGDLFGYQRIPRPLSIRAQLRALEGNHFHVNVICVAPEDWPTWTTHQICHALQFTRDAFGTVGIGLGRIEWYAIPSDQAGSYAIITGWSEASDLTASWTVPNDGLDLFVVRTIIDSEGESAIDGSCDKNAKGMTGSVVELYEGADDYAGNGFAHEMGHYLGLDHVPIEGNFLGGVDGASNSWSGVLDWQGERMKTHCLMRRGWQ